MSRYALWSADYAARNGQAIVTARVARLLAGPDTVEFLYGGRGLAALGRWLRSSAALWRRAWSGSLLLYLVCSRSVPGFVRDLPAYVAARKATRTVVHVHGSDIVDLLARPWLGALARWALGPTELVVPSLHLVAPLQARGLRVRVCENFVEPSAAPQSTAAAGGLTVVWNSNVIASKGFFETAEAVRRLAHEGMPVRLIALGAPLRDREMSAERCAARLQSLKGEPWFQHLGTVDRAASIGVLRAADVVCLPSRYASECQPLAVIEAMCEGVDVLLADTPALRATAGDYPCRFVAETTPEAIAAALRAVPVGTGARREAAAARARERYSTARFDRDMRAILDARGADARAVQLAGSP